MSGSPFRGVTMLDLDCNMKRSKSINSETLLGDDPMNIGFLIDKKILSGF